MAFAKYREGNAGLIEACASLGYLHADDLTLDATWGLGKFWTRCRPDRLVGCDLKPTGDVRADFRRLPFAPFTFDVVVFDPPYKLNGTPALDEMDVRYGVNVPARWQDRMRLILDGLVECARLVRPGGRLLVKCQDQVVSGAVRWQTDEITMRLDDDRWVKIDRLDMESYRPQPSGRRQVHARRNHSTLLVFQRRA